MALPRYQMELGTQTLTSLTLFPRVRILRFASSNDDFARGAPIMKACKRFALVLSAMSLTLACAGLAKAQSFSLEQVTSSPFPSDLVTTRRGDRIAWAFDAEGKRNIWIAEAPAFAARQLTHYDSDDGGELTDLVFAPSGNLIAFARGGEQGKNSAGEYTNPTSDPAGAKKEVWVVDTRTGRITRIGEGESPIFSAAGDQVLWIRGGDLLTAPALGGKERKLFEMRGNVSAPTWSPDGTQLAFASMRGDHSFISIYEIRTNQLRFISPGVDRDTGPRWSPDGTRIAFIRQFSVPDTFSIDRDRLQPWAIWVGNARTGEANQIWRSGDADNDSYPGNQDQAFWQW